MEFDALDGILLPEGVPDKIAHMPEPNRDTLSRLIEHIRAIEDLCPVDASGASTLDRLSDVYGPLLFGVEDTEANASDVDLASCCVKLLLTHPALYNITAN